MKRFTMRILALLCVLSLLCTGCAKSGEQPKTTGDGGNTPLPWVEGGDTPAGTDAPANTDKPSEPEPEPEPSYADAYTAYLEVLSANRESILGYDWQKGFTTDENTYMNVPAGATESVALADVWGDDTPELLYLTAIDHEGFRYAAKLHVCTWDGSAARELLDAQDCSLDGQVGGGMVYRLFQIEGEKDLWLFEDYYSEGSVEIYRKFSAEGEMKAVLTLEHSVFPEENASGEWEDAHKWSLDGKESTQAAVEALIPAEKMQDKGLIMRNLDYYEYAGDPDITQPENAYSYRKSGAALTCDAAVEYLRDALGLNPAQTDESAFFARIAGGFCFASGVGGWSSDITVAPDGTFTGSFHDSDMGDMGDSYPNGTIYLCSFSGRFGNVRRIDEYTYSMRLADMKVEPMEQERIEDGTRYIAGQPYGLENADEIMVYLPGSWMANLPAGFVSWVSMPLAWGSEDRPLLLPFCGLYNVNEAEGWFSGEG